MTKQKADTLPIMRPPTRLRQRRTDIDRLQPLPPLLLLLVRNRVRHHELTERALPQGFDRIPRQNAMRDDGDDFLGIVRDQRVDRFDQRAARIGHVVHEDGRLAFDVTDEHHAADFVGARALFVD